MNEDIEEIEEDVEKGVELLRHIKTQLVLGNALLQIIATNTTPAAVKLPSQLVLTFGTPVSQ
jgi:hypothetical protein